MATESVCIKWVEFSENVRGFLSLGTRQTVQNNEVSVLSRFLKAGFQHLTVPPKLVFPL